MMKFDLQAFVAALPVMGKGMAGIFIVTLVIVLCVALLNHVTNSLSDKK